MCAWCACSAGARVYTNPNSYPNLYLNPNPNPNLNSRPGPNPNPNPNPNQVRLLTQGPMAAPTRAVHGQRTVALRPPPPAAYGEGGNHGTLMDELCGRNQLGWCALHTAAFRGDEVGVRLLLEAGMPPNWPTADGCTALHLAAAQGHKLTLELLIARGGGVNASGAGGETPLGVAAARGDSHAASHLLAAGAHPQCADRSGWTPMHSALWRGDRDLTREMLRHGGAVQMHPAAPTPPPPANVGRGREWEAPQSRAEREPPRLPAGEPIDYAPAHLKRALGGDAVAGEAVMRFY